MNENLPIPAFDREFELAELIADIPRDRLQKTLILLLGSAFRISDTRDRVLIGAADAPEGAKRLPLTLELEPIGYLECAGADDIRLKSAITLLELLFRSTARYKMASSLHIESVQADYETLKRKHAELEASETRYKTLSEQLENRVQEQVTVIEKTTRQLYQAEKMASLGRLAAGVAHEINNPIGFARSNLSTAASYLEKFATLGAAIKSGKMPHQVWNELDMNFVLGDFAELLHESINGIDRVARIVADLKGFSNVDRGEEEMADITVGMRQACSVIAGQLPTGTSLIEDYHSVPRILCLPGYLNQAFLNILQNAAQAVVNMEKGEIRLNCEQVGEEIRIRITDNGCGIPADDLPRIFEPFFTTREPGQGTGLGLSVVQDTIRLHGGRVEAESQVGKGTTITIHLPT